MRIDSHQHYWQYMPKDYPWITSNMRGLQRNFLPKDIHATLELHKMNGVIAVQARQTKSETEFLLQLSEEYSWIYGVVGWIDLLTDDCLKELDQVRHEKLKGFRHLIQDEKNPALFFENQQFNHNVNILLQHGYVYELLFHEKDLQAAINFCIRHDAHPLVIDHLGKPNIKMTNPKEWLKKLSKLSELPHVYCKLSGLITEASTEWKKDDIKPFIEGAIEVFTPKRLMFGSDWPVCLLSGSYEDVYEVIYASIGQLNMDEQAMIMGEVAQKIYKI